MQWFPEVSMGTGVIAQQPAFGMIEGMFVVAVSDLHPVYPVAETKVARGCGREQVRLGASLYGYAVCFERRYERLRWKLDGILNGFFSALL